MNQKIKKLSNYVIVISDIVVIVLSFVLSNLLRFQSFEVPVIEDASYMSFMWFAIIANLVVTLFFRINMDYLTRGQLRELYLVGKQYVLVAGLILLYFYISQSGNAFSRLQFCFFFCFVYILTVTSHLLIKDILGRRYLIKSFEKVILITDTISVETIIEQVNGTESEFQRIEGVVLIDQPQGMTQVAGVPVLGNGENYKEVLKKLPADAVFINWEHGNDIDVGEMMEFFDEMGVTIHLNLHEYQYPFGMKQFGQIGPYGVVSYVNYSYEIRDIVLKRMMDVVGGLLLFMAMCITFPFVAIGIELQSPGPIFFKQTRIGKNGRRFEIYKYRSMYLDAEKRKKELMAQNEMDSDFIFKLKDDPRIFPVGKWIRKLSIDELPQAINILKGDMSLVGTRPPTEDEFNQYEAYHRRRVSIKPGLTGMWQVSGRSRITDFDKIVELDCKYIDSWNLRVDFYILIKTVWVVLFGRGAE